MTEEPASPGRFLAVVCSLAGAAACCLPATLADRLRSGVRDGAAPGHIALATARQTVDRYWRTQRATQQQADADRIIELERQVAELTRQSLQWQTRAATLATDLDRARTEHPLALASKPTQPLLVADALEARVLSWEGGRGDSETAGIAAGESWRAVLDRGRDRGIHSEELVLAANEPVVDLGADQRVEADQPVLAGRSVVGRIGAVGTWTSTIQPLTSPKFRGHAQLIRSSSDQAVEGASGVLSGTGTGCRLEFVAPTEPVRIGDLVVTPVRQSPGGEPLLFGRVTRAELSPGASHWSIEVEPACDLSKTSRVSILRIHLNSRRSAAMAERAP